MSRTVVFTPEAEAQLTELFGYIAAEASPEIAARFTDGIVTYCESLSNFLPVEAGAMTFAMAFALLAIEGASPSHSMWMRTGSMSSEFSMAARIMERPCAKRNERTRLTAGGGHLWPLLGHCPGNMPCGRDGPGSLRWRLALS